jgi:hypothetical protein
MMLMEEREREQRNELTTRLRLAEDAAASAKAAACLLEEEFDELKSAVAAGNECGERKRERDRES